MSKRLSPLESPMVIGLSAAGFYLLFQLNDLLFQQLDYARGVSWLFLPSGLRLGLVLLLGFRGAVGVVLGSLLIGLDNDLPWIEAVLAALVSGLAPWMALWVSQRVLGLQSDLSNLSPAMLLKMAVVFSLISAVAHQLLYLSLGITQSFFKSLSVMAIGDLAGTLVVLYVIKWLIGRRAEHP